MKRAVAIGLLALALAGCYPAADVDNESHADEWAYVRGPGGETCLVYIGGSGNTTHMGMDCDRITPPEGQEP